MCAANFGEFCSIVGQEATEKLLVRNNPYLGSCKGKLTEFLILKNKSDRIYERSLLWTRCNCLLWLCVSKMPKFFDLCSDSLWGIRKACAECFMTVSNSTSPEVRRAKLSPLFISLISDQSRWVRYVYLKKIYIYLTKHEVLKCLCHSELKSFLPLL